MRIVETRSLSLSIALHALAVLIAAVGLPILLPPKSEPVPMVMTVELLPISAMSNVKPSDKPITEEKNAKTVKNSKPIPPTAVEKPKEPPPPEPVKTETAPKDVVEKPADKPKPKEEKPKEDAKPKPDEFQALLSKMQAEAKANQDKTAKDKTNTEKNTTQSDAPYDESMPLSISEKDMIKSQFIPCWTMPAGAKDANTLAVRVKVKLQPDGTVIEAAVAPDLMGRYNSDTFFRAAADSAVRAVHKCSPLKNLPPDKYGTWKDMEINFNPQDL